MAGRRLRKTIYDAMVAADPSYNNTVVVIAGLSNAYSGYITTKEEFQVQRYEGASTVRRQAGREYLAVCVCRVWCA